MIIINIFVRSFVRSFIFKNKMIRINMHGIVICSTYICIQSKSFHPAPKIVAHLRNLYEASMTARSSIYVIRGYDYYY